MAVPTRQTSQAEVDQWNATMRSSPLYQSFVQRNGLVGKKGGWSRGQQDAWERELAASGQAIPSGMHIDQGGNLNQKNTLVKKAAVGAAIGGAALTGFGLAGMGPLAGLGGGAAATGGAAASTSGGLLPATFAGANTLAGITVPTATSGIFGASTAGAGMGLGSALTKGIGWLNKGTDALDAVSRVTGKAAQGSQQQRVQENTQQQNGAMAALQAENARFQAELARLQAQGGQQDRSRRNALLQMLVGGASDSQVTPGNPAIAAAMGSRSGGLTPSSMLGGGRREALMAMLQSPEQQALTVPTYNPITMPTPEKAGALEKLLGYSGLATGLIGALGGKAPKLAPDSRPVDDEELF